MHIVVTGGRGFVGRHVEQAALAAGHTVGFFDKKSGQDILGDLSGLEGADAVLHLAGLLGTTEMFDFIEDSIRTNILGTYRVAQWCSQNNANLVLIDVPDVFNSIYCATKVGAHRICSAMNGAGMLKLSSVIAYNAFGEGQHTEDPALRKPRKFMPTFSVAAWHNQPIPIWGSGEALIDPIHVSQVARMMVDAARFSNDEVFDGGTGNEFTVNEIAQFVLNHTGSTAGIAYEPMRRGELPKNVGATGRGWELLDWKPTFSWDQLADTIDWYKGKTVVE